jgi:hypothetical protein
MKVNELRIGNYITEPNNEDKEPFKIWGIYYEERNNKVNNLPITYFKPILLTEEWLLRFGFKKVPTYFEEVRFGIEYHLTVKSDVEFIIEYFDDFSCAILGSKDDIGITPLLENCRYVHQLQNLYFALTGEELTIK